MCYKGGKHIFSGALQIFIFLNSWKIFNSLCNLANQELPLALAFLFQHFCVSSSWERATSSILWLVLEYSLKYTVSMCRTQKEILTFSQALGTSGVLNSLLLWNSVFTLSPNQGEDFRSLLLSSSSSIKYCIRDRIRTGSNLLVSILMATKPSDAASVTFSSSHLAAISVDCSSSPARHSTHLS